MSRLVFALCFLSLSFLHLSGQEGSIQWEEFLQVGGGQDDVSTQLIVNETGEMYLSGIFREGILWGDSVLVSVGKNDGMLAQLPKDGSPGWIQILGGTDNDGATALAQGPDGSLYLGGYFRDTMMIGGQIYVAQGQTDAFLAKFSSDGQFQWLYPFGSVSYDQVSAVHTDSQGLVYIGGDFRNEIVLGNDTLSAMNQADGFVACLDADGQFLWTQAIPGTGNEQVSSISGSSDGKIVVSGTFTLELMLAGDTTVSAGGQDMLVVKFAENGLLDWYQAIGGPAQDSPIENLQDSQGNVFVAGFHRDSILIDGQVIPISGAGEFDGLLLKLDAQGQFQWAQTLTDPERGAFLSVELVHDNHLLIAGYQRINGQADLLIQGWGSQGQLLHTDTLSSAGNEVPASIHWQENQLYVSGYFDQTLSWDSLSITTHGGRDMFIGKANLAISTARDPLHLQEQLSLFPNPTNGVLHLQLPTVQEAPIQLSLLDLNGRLCGESSFPPGLDQFSYRLPDIPRGTYLLRLRLDHTITYYPVLYRP